MVSQFKNLVCDKLKLDYDELILQHDTAYVACYFLLATDSFWKGGVSKFPFFRCQFFLLLEMKGCPAHSKLDEASIFELEIITKRSPFYAFTAFNVPFDDCIKMSKCLDYSISDDVLAYNVVYRRLLTAPKVAFSEVNSLLEEFNIEQSMLPILSSIQPFGPGVLAKHPLRTVDPRYISPAESVKFLKNPSEIISRTRERVNLVNRLICRGDAYMLECPMTEFVVFIESLIT